MSACKSQMEKSDLMCLLQLPQPQIGSKHNLCSSSIIMLCMTIYVIIMSEMVSKSHCLTRFLTIFYWFYNTSNALSTSFHASSWHFVNAPYLSLQFVNGLNKTRPRWVTIICKEVVPSIGVSVHLKRNVLFFFF